jgi:hypothetical protein
MPAREATSGILIKTSWPTIPGQRSAFGFHFGTLSPAFNHGFPRKPNMVRAGREIGSSDTSYAPRSLSAIFGQPGSAALDRAMYYARHV